MKGGGLGDRQGGHSWEGKTDVRTYLIGPHDSLAAVSLC